MLLVNSIHYIAFTYTTRMLTVRRKNFNRYNTLYRFVKDKRRFSMKFFEIINVVILLFYIIVFFEMDC